MSSFSPHNHPRRVLAHLDLGVFERTHRLTADKESLDGEILNPLGRAPAIDDAGGDGRVEVSNGDMGEHVADRRPQLKQRLGALHIDILKQDIAGRRLFLGKGVIIDRKFNCSL